MSKIKTLKIRFFLWLLIVTSLFHLSSCTNESKVELDYSFKTAVDVEKEIEDINQIPFDKFQDLDLGFYEGTIWIQLEVSNGNKPQSLIVMGNDLINRNYRFYKLDPSTNKLISENASIDLEKYDHRTYNNSKPNFRVDLNSNEVATYYISTSSDGRILQANPKIISVEEYTTINSHSIIIDAVFYGCILILLMINLFHWSLIKNKVYYFYFFYILSSCFMYLFVEGRLYGLGLSHHLIDHLMFISIRFWILSSILFASNFLGIKKTMPRFYSLIKYILMVSLGGTTLYQLIFFKTSISFLHEFENITGFIWILLALIMVFVSFKHRKKASKYYLISFSIFIIFILLGLTDSHFTILPGDPFSYFKIGTIFEFIGFTYFISLLIKQRIQETQNLEGELNEYKERNQRLEEKPSIGKTDLVGIFKLLESSLSNDFEWEDFKRRFKELNPNFLENLIKKHPNLSKSDIRLLTLIKVDYTQKEIANILGIEPDSVKKAKSRVRKKLELPSSIVLNDYLSKY
jgi:DNA-binding CsgD family transcriptional regulator